MYYHDTAPQASETNSEDIDPEVANMLDLLDADAEASRGYAVPVDDDAIVSW